MCTCPQSVIDSCQFIPVHYVFPITGFLCRVNHLSVLFMPICTHLAHCPHQSSQHVVAPVWIINSCQFIPVSALIRGKSLSFLTSMGCLSSLCVILVKSIVDTITLLIIWYHYWELSRHISNGRIGVVLIRTESLVCVTPSQFHIWQLITAGLIFLVLLFCLIPWCCGYWWHLHCVLVFPCSLVHSLVFLRQLHFFSCLYCLPPFLCSFLSDMALWILLFGIPYFFAISACDLLLAMQSPMARSNSI